MAEMDEMEFGAGINPDARRKSGESTNKWIGAKFDLTDESDSAVVDKAAVLEKRVGSLKGLITAMVQYVYLREVERKGK